MTAEEFTRWLAAMRAAGLARSDAECGRLLGVTPVSIVAMKQNGVTGHAARRTKLACAHLLMGINRVSEN